MVSQPQRSQRIVSGQSELSQHAFDFASLYLRYAELLGHDQDNIIAEGRFTELEAEYYSGYSEPDSSWRAVLSEIAFGPRRVRALSLALAATRDRLSLLEGYPGCGKSLILRKVAWDVCSNAAENGQLPVAFYLDLKKLTRPRNAAIDRALVSAFAAEQAAAITGAGAAANGFVASLARPVIDPPECLFLFDSFDEIPDVLSAEDASETIELYFQAISAFVAGRANCRAVLSTRSFRRPKQSTLPKYRVVPLTWAQRADFIEKARLIERVEERLYRFIGQTDGAMAFIVENPLYLHLLIEYAKTSEDAPGGAYQLFAGFIKNTLHENEAALRSKFRSSTEDLAAFAELVSFTIVADPSLGLNPHRKDLLLAIGRLPGDESAHRMCEALEFLRLARGESTEESHSLLERRFTFSHRRFQEYFTTSYVKRFPDAVSEQELLRDARWRETTVVLLRSGRNAALDRLLLVAEGILLEAGDALRERSMYARYRPDGESEENYVAEFFPWPPHALQLLSLLQDGFADDPGRLPGEIRDIAGGIVQSAFLRGRLGDRLVALEVSGSMRDDELKPVLRSALAFGSQLLDDAVFSQIRRLSNSPDLARWVRISLLNRAFLRQLRRQKRSLLAFLERLNDGKKLYFSASLLCRIEVIDAAIHVVAVAVVLAAPRLTLELRGESICFLAASAVFRPAYWYFGRNSLYKLRFQNRERRKSRSPLPQTPVSRWVQSLDNSDASVPLYLILLVLGFRLFPPFTVVQDGPPKVFIWMVCGWVIAGAWAPMATLAVLNGEYTSPRWWPFLTFSPILLLGSRPLRYFREVRSQVSKDRFWYLGGLAVCGALLLASRAVHAFPSIEMPEWVRRISGPAGKAFDVLLGLAGIAMFMSAAVRFYRDFVKWFRDVQRYRKAKRTIGVISVNDFISELGAFHKDSLRIRFIRLAAGRGLVDPSGEALWAIKNLNLMLERENRRLGYQDPLETGVPVVDRFRAGQLADKRSLHWGPVILDELTKLEKQLGEAQPATKETQPSTRIETQTMKDFFISYNRADRNWAAWIAWVLEEEGYTVAVQDWDFRPGENFVLDMHESLLNTRATLAVLSDDYLNSSFTRPEWAAAFANDPTGSKRLLVPFKVRECAPDGLLAQIVYVDLIGLEEADARAALLGAFQPGRPTAAPDFPGRLPQSTLRQPEPSFPGTPSQAGQTPIIDRLADRTQSIARRDANPESPGSQIQQRMALMRDLNALPVALFNMLVTALKPTNGLISPMPAPQADRTVQLLAWAESSVGCGLPVVVEALTAAKGAT